MISQKLINERIKNYERNLCINSPMSKVYIRIALSVLDNPPEDYEWKIRDIEKSKNRDTRTRIIWREFRFLKEGK